MPRNNTRAVGLALRMLIVVLLTPLVALALVAAAVILLPRRELMWLLVALAVGILATVAAFRTRKLAAGRTLEESDDPELFALVERLCALGAISRPELMLSDEPQPNSWVVQLPGHRPRLYLTRGLRELLSVDELAAVLAHELAHIANHDAVVMSAVGLPGAVLRNARGAGAAILVPIGLLSMVGTNLLSRYRELAADAGSAQLTGRPSALASALLKVSDSLAQIPAADLRSTAAMNAFNLVPVSGASGWWRESGMLSALMATHPPMPERIEALHQLERARQSRRVA